MFGDVSSELTFRACINFAVPLCAMVPRLSISSSRVMPIPVSLVNKTTHTSQYHDIKLHMHKEEENSQKQLGIPSAATVHIIGNVKLIALKPPTDPKWSEASKDKVETDSFISGAHMIVMVPASGTVLIRISKLGFKSIKLGSVTLKNRSLSRASLALLQDPTTKHNKTSWKGTGKEPCQQ